AHAHLDRIDFDRLERRIQPVGDPILPVVEEIVAIVPDGLGEWAHYGTTTQDIMDTATSLQIRRALDALERDLAAISSGLKRVRSALPSR
ncbi:MAG: hypothetical protein VW835_21965, partial [Rickettsiales bacterium]